METSENLDALIERIRSAFESADLGAIGELVDEHARWGPPDEAVPTCQTRGQVLEWYRQAKEAGVRAEVNEAIAVDGCIVLGLKVSGRDDTTADGGTTDRWQVLTVRNSRIVEIRGYEDRESALAYAANPVPTWGPLPLDDPG